MKASKKTSLACLFALSLAQACDESADPSDEVASTENLSEDMEEGDGSSGDAPDLDQAPSACSANTDECRAWAAAFCKVELDACADRSAPVEAADVQVDCVIAEQWTGADTDTCDEGTVASVCLGTLFFGEGSPTGGSFVRDGPDGETEAIRFEELGQPLGYLSCDTQKPPPNACGCIAES